MEIYFFKCVVGFFQASAEFTLLSRALLFGNSLFLLKQWLVNYGLIVAFATLLVRSESNLGVSCCGCIQVVYIKCMS